MFLFVLGCIALIAAAVILVSKFFDGFKWLSLIPFIVAILCFVFSVIAIVPTGYTGILVTMGKVSDYTLDSGLNTVLPWQNVVLMDNREQKIPFNASAFSSDIQEVDLTGSVIFSIDKTTAMDLYRNVGTNYAEIIIHPQINEDVKAIISKYTAEGLIGQRALLSAEILEMLRNDLSTYGLNIISVAIENIDFTDAFEQAVEAKQVATQTKQRAQTEQEQATMEAEQAAERRRIAAQADADVAKINADAAAYAIKAEAEAQASANELIANSLTESLIEYTQVSNWDGKLPTTVVSSDVGSLPIIVEDTQVKD